MKKKEMKSHIIFFFAVTLQPASAAAATSRCTYVNGGLEMGSVESNTAFVLNSHSVCVLGKVGPSVEIRSRGSDIVLHLGGIQRESLLSIGSQTVADQRTEKRSSLKITIHYKPLYLLVFPGEDTDPITIHIEGSHAEHNVLTERLKALKEERLHWWRDRNPPQSQNERRRNLQKDHDKLEEEFNQLSERLENIEKIFDNGETMLVSFPISYFWYLLSDSKAGALLAGSNPSEAGQLLIQKYIPNCKYRVIPGNHTYTANFARGPSVCLLADEKFYCYHNPCYPLLECRSNNYWKLLPQLTQLDEFGK